MKLEGRQAMRGKPSWWDILVDDLDVAQRFYGAVLDWTFPISGPDFVVVSDGTEPVGQLYSSGERVSGPHPSIGMISPIVY